MMRHDTVHALPRPPSSNRRLSLDSLSGRVRERDRRGGLAGGGGGGAVLRAYDSSGRGHSEEGCLEEPDQ